MTEQDVHPLQGLKDQYDKLCKQRDDTYAKAQPLEDELDKVNAEMEVLRSRAADLAAQIETVWGGASWIALKKQIAAIARALSAPNGLLAKAE